MESSRGLLRPRRWNSLFLPPKLSEVRIVLLGGDVPLTNRVGNFILGRSAFETEVPLTSVKLHSERASGHVEGRFITIINTPHLYNPKLSQEEVTLRVKECISLSDPGPYVFLFVLQSKLIPHELQDRVRRTLETYSPLSMKHTIILTTGEDHGYINECDLRHHRIKNISTFDQHEVLQLLEKIDAVVKETGGRDLPEKKQSGTERRHQDHLPENTAETDGDTVEERIEEIKEPKQTPHLKLVLLGKERVKTSRSKKSSESSSVCVTQEEVSGHQITLVELPALCNTRLSEQEVMQQTLHCVSVCDPGVHAFFIMVPEGPLTDEDKGEIETFLRIFGSRVNDHTMFIINQGSPKKEIDKNLQGLIKRYGGRSKFYSSELSANHLFPYVKDLLDENNSSQYTMAMYAQAQVEAQLEYKSEIENLLQQVRELKKKRNQIEGSSKIPDILRIVLLGKTGVGKSASGNTILGKDAFNEDLSSESVTTVCQKETAEFRGRQITVIDTPGLFDTNTDHEETRKEIVKCISMAAPGPHVFLLVLRIGDRFTQEEREVVKIIKETFGETSNMYTIILFTRGDDLKKQTIEQYIETAGAFLNRFLSSCGRRYHVLNNNDKSSYTQVQNLLDKIDSMVKVNGGSCYTNEMFQKVEKALEKEKERILKEREEQIEREKEELKTKHEAEMKNMRREMKKEKERLEEEQRQKEEEFKQREEEIKREMTEREQNLKEDFWKRKEDDDLKMKEQMQEINREREENRKQWERQREEDQKRRDQEEKERRRKEEEWKEQQREEREKFKREKEEMENNKEKELKKLQKEYEEKAAEEDRRIRDLEEKIKNAEESKKKELQDLQLSQQREREQRMKREEEERKEQQELWEKRIAAMEEKWSLEQDRKQKQHEWERQKEKEERDIKEKERKEKEEEERRRIENEANEKIRNMEEQIKKQRQDERERRKKDKEHKKEMEERLQKQQEKFRKEKEDVERKYNEEMERNLFYIQKQQKKQMETLKRETEEAARKQAEEEFSKRLDEELKEAKEEGIKEGSAKVEAERTNLGRFVDNCINRFCLRTKH